MTVADVEEAIFAEQWARWHQEHEDALADPHGFLAITGLHWLGADPERFGDVPGAWSTGPDGPSVLLDDGEELVLDGAAVRGRFDFGVIAERGGRLAGFANAVAEVARRGGRDLVRPRHPEHPLRTGYAGTPAYPPSRSWVVAGRFLPFAEPRPVTVGAAVEGLEHVYDSPGKIAFEVRGAKLRLTAFNGGAAGELFVLFTDATSGITTYAANRSLAVAAPDGEGQVTLDFNRATNLPCAYTDFATCPLPPAENRLSIAVEVGEQIPYERR